MQIPLKYILRSSSSRRLTTGVTILGIALVVFVFTAVLMMANGVQQTLRSTGSDDNVTVVRKAATSEIMSIIDREAAGIVTNLPKGARAPEGQPISSKEVAVVINLRKIGSDRISNVTVRAIGEAALQLRPQVRIIAGRMFKWGALKLTPEPALRIASLALRSVGRSSLVVTYGRLSASSTPMAAASTQRRGAISIRSLMPSDVRPSLRLRFDSRTRMISLNSCPPSTATTALSILCPREKRSFLRNNPR